MMVRFRAEFPNDSEGISASLPHLQAATFGCWPPGGVSRVLTERDASFFAKSRAADGTADPCTRCTSAHVETRAQTAGTPRVAKPRGVFPLTASDQVLARGEASTTSRRLMRPRIRPITQAIASRVPTA